MAQDLNLLYTRRMEKESALDPNPVSDTTDGEIAIDATTAKAHDNAFKWLEAFTVTLNYFYLQANRIARAKLWYIFT
jgi:hypothetical protein